MIGIERLVLVVLLCFGFAACGEAEPELVPLPDPAAAAARYGTDASAYLRGNLLEVKVPVSDALLQGGKIWIQSGPYFYLFSPATQELLINHPELAAVRVITQTSEGKEVARALLRRDTLNEISWRHALAIRSLAQSKGTRSPRKIEELIYFGQDHTTYEYNPEFDRS